MKVVIFCGGPGARFWPVSRKASPKQFKKMIAGRSTFDLTVDRMRPEIAWTDIYAATGDDQVHMVVEQKPEIPPQNIIGEPARRDLGPAVGYIVALLNTQSPQEPFGIFWSDHVINDNDAFKKALQTAEELSQENPDKIIFWGEKVRFPNQNLGYIKFGEKTESRHGVEVFQFAGFEYRPDLETANKYMSSGEYLWNTGYFISTPAFLAKLYEKSAPEMWQSLQAIVNEFGKPTHQEKFAEIYPSLEKISFDDLIVEKVSPEQGLVIASDMSWSDAGTYESLTESLQSSPEANVTQGNIIDLESTNSYLYNDTEQLLTTIGLDDMIVAVTKDAILVCPKKKNPDIKKILKQFEGSENEKYL